MRVGRVVVTALLAVGSVVPALWPYSDADGTETLYTPIAGIFDRAPAYEITQLQVDESRALDESVVPFLKLPPGNPAGDQARIDFRTRLAEPTIAAQRAKLDGAYKTALRRRNVFTGRLLLLSSAVLMLLAVAVFIGGQRVRRGSSRSGAALLVVAAALVPLLAPIVAPAAAVHLPIVSLLTSKPSTSTSALSPPVDGASWSPALAVAALPRITAEHRSADNYFVEDSAWSDAHEMAQTRLVWSLAATILAALVALRLRRRVPTADAALPQSPSIASNDVAATA